MTVSAKCPNCETDLNPNTVIVSETQESTRTYACRKCGTSLKAEDLTKSGRPDQDQNQNSQLLFGTLKVVKGLYTLKCNILHNVFEFEIPNKKKDKNLNIIDDEFEVEPELEQVLEPVTVPAK